MNTTEELTREAIEEAVAKAIKEIVAEENAYFHVDQKNHYKQDPWIGNLIKWGENVRPSFLRPAVQMSIVGLLALLLICFSLWGCKGTG